MHWSSRRVDRRQRCQTSSPLTSRNSMNYSGDARRPYLIVQNWKMDGHKHLIKDLVEHTFKTIPHRYAMEFVVCPSFVYLPYVGRELDTFGDNRFLLGAQDVCEEKYGDYTGEVSLSMLGDIGVDVVILGHSDRRMNRGEDYEIIAKKLQLIVSDRSSIQAVVCIGESKYEGDRLEGILQHQLDLLMPSDLITTEEDEEDYIDHLILAYQPPPHIDLAPAEIINTIIGIRKSLMRKFNAEVATGMRIIYGGYLDEKMLQELANFKHLDGFLISDAEDRDGFLRDVIMAKHGRPK